MRCFASAFIAIANTPDTRPPAPDAAVLQELPAASRKPVIVGIGPLQRQPVERGKIVDRAAYCKHVGAVGAAPGVPMGLLLSCGTGMRLDSMPGQLRPGAGLR